MLHFRRVHPDTLRVYLESPTGRIGTVVDRPQNVRRLLDTRAHLRVLLNEGEPGRRVTFPFQVRRLELGSVHRFSSGGSQAELSSGTVTFSERILLGRAPARSRTLQPGDQFNVPMNRGRETGSATGSITADRGDPGMHVDVTVRGSTGQLMRYGSQEVLKSNVVHAVKNDPVILLVCGLIMLLLPVRAIITDRAKGQIGPYFGQ
jgi:hypothetical protein